MSKKIEKRADYGRGLEGALDVQRRFNEMYNHIAEHIRQSAPEDPFVRLRRIASEGRQ